MELITFESLLKKEKLNEAEAILATQLAIIDCMKCGSSADWKYIEEDLKDKVTVNILYLCESEFNTICGDY